MDLTEKRKFIIYDKHQRPPCRTKVTVFIDSGHCDTTLKELKYLCKNLKEKQNLKVYFQGMILFIMEEKMKCNVIIQRCYFINGVIYEGKSFYRMYRRPYLWKH